MRATIFTLARVWALACSTLMLAAAAMAAPGAHGPNGEHLDENAQPGAVSVAPRMEAKSELFELVAILSGGELSILIDRYDTNEPVLAGKVEVEAGPLKTVAKFHADHGDYAVDDAAFLKALGQPGEHALVFTVIAGEQSDLLDGTLRVAAAQDHAHDRGVDVRTVILGILTAAVVLGALAWAVRRKRAGRAPIGDAA
jgi:hypothetical protein